MNLFTRITATLAATADQAVSRFENHDAIAQGALRQARQALVKARVQNNRVKRDGDALRKKAEELNNDDKLWTQRARDVAAEDEEKALQCLAHRQQCRQLQAQTQERLSRHEALESTVQARLKTVESRLEQIIQQRNHMRSRESVAEAMCVMGRCEDDGQDNVDTVFERWEVSIGETEMRADAHYSLAECKDTLQREYEAKERTDALKLELTELLAENRNAQHE